MSTKTEWVKNPDGSRGETWNPVTGCTPVSAGCANCYAARMSHRLHCMGHNRYADLTWGPRFNGTVRCHDDLLEQPLRWRKPRHVFVCSMGDMYHRDVPDTFRDKMHAVMALCPQHTFLVLTKRPEEALKYYSYGASEYYPRETDIQIAMEEEHGWTSRDDILTYAPPGSHVPDDPPWPLPNVWLGTSCEDQATADERIPELLKCPAAVRFVSCEPLIAPVTLSPWIKKERTPGLCPHGSEHCRGCVSQSMPGISWVIAGGETGPGARPMDPNWARSLRDQCQAAGVPFFFKAMGGVRKKSGVHKRACRKLDGRTWDEMPEVHT